MAQCSNCGSPLSDAQKFCGTCGNVATEQTAAPEAAAATEAAALAAAPEVSPPPLPTQPPVATPPAFAPPAYAPPPPPGYAPQPGYGPGGAAWQAPRQSKKALWIGLAAAVVVIAVAAILVFVVFWDQVSGKGDGGGGGGGGGSEASAQQMLAASWANSENATDASGAYEATITLNMDTSQMTAEEQQMSGLLGGPITASGTFASTQSPLGMDLTAKATLFGQNIDAGVRLVDGKPFILFSGQWYEAPPELQQSMVDSGTQTDPAQLKALLSSLAVDPSTWLTGLKEVGSEEIDGIKTVHLSGSPNIAKMVTDITALMNSPEGQNLMNLTGSVADTSGTPVSVPTAQEIADLQTQLEALLKTATIDLWLSKDDDSIRKLAINLEIDPSAADTSADTSGLASGLTGLKSIVVSASVTLASGQPAAIVAPTGALPFTDLQSALESDTGLLGMILGGSLGF